jgi:hypothetical protein
MMPLQMQPTLGSAAQAPATPSVITINEDDLEAAQLPKALGLGNDDGD